MFKTAMVLLNNKTILEDAMEVSATTSFNMSTLCMPSSEEKKYEEKLKMSTKQNRSREGKTGDK